MATKHRSAKVETIRDCKDCPAPDNQEMAFRLLANFMVTESNYPSATCRALEAAGVDLIDENGGGPGVRLRKGFTKGARP